MRRALREPVVQFLLGGALLFLVHALLADPGSERPDRIVVTEDRVSMLAQAFERTWMRPPSDAELDGLIDDYLTEEVLYREALALGLDRDDLVVRRRMRQKLEFLNEGLTETSASEEDLRAFHAAHPERFALPSRVSFSQIFVDAPSPAAAEPRAALLLARLRAGESHEVLGDPSLLVPEMRDATPGEVSDRFGSEFAEQLHALPVSEWSGPVSSSFGLHLVRVDRREPGRAPRFEEVRGAVEREWAEEQSREARERFYALLRARYELVVRKPSPESPRNPPPS